MFSNAAAADFSAWPPIFQLAFGTKIHIRLFFLSPAPSRGLSESLRADRLQSFSG